MKLQDVLSKRCIEISDMSKLSIKDKIINDIDYVFITVFVGDKELQKIPYILKKDDYIICKLIIDKIVKKCLKKSNNNYEVFAKICVILSKYFKYDATNIVNEVLKKEDLEILTRIQGAYSLLIENMGTCSSVAFTLFNICMCAGIECIMVNGKSRQM